MLHVTRLWIGNRIHDFTMSSSTLRDKAFFELIADMRIAFKKLKVREVRVIDCKRVRIIELEWTYVFYHDQKQ